MDTRTTTRRAWTVLLVVIIVAGLASRSIHSGSLLFDKYLGDALYAAMVYVIVRIAVQERWSALWVAAAAMGIMIAIECFQLTGIPRNLLQSGSAVVRGIARLLGTEFSVADLAAYAVGIGVLARADGRRQASSGQDVSSGRHTS